MFKKCTYSYNYILKSVAFILLFDFYFKQLFFICIGCMECEQNGNCEIKTMTLNEYEATVWRLNNDIVIAECDKENCRTEKNIFFKIAKARIRTLGEKKTYSLELGPITDTFNEWNIELFDTTKSESIYSVNIILTS